jgi:hypothetical protein
LGDCLLLAVLENYISSPKIFGYFFEGNSYAIIATKMGWVTFWAFFSRSHDTLWLWVTLKSESLNKYCSWVEILYLGHAEIAFSQ